MATQATPAPFEVKHGHTQTHVIVVLGRAVDNLQFTPEQAEAFMAAMRESIQKLREHQAKGQH